MRPKLGMAVLGVLALVSAACGSRLPDDTLKALDARNANTAAPVADANGTTDATTATDASGVDTGSPSGDSSSGPSTGGGTATTVKAASSCGTGGATAPGVTATEIKVASIVTDSGPLPGATEGSYRGAASYFAKVNAEGGVCGRKITLLKGDDGLDPAKGRAEFLRLEPKVLGIVSNFSVADSGYIDLIKSTGVPYASLTVDPAGADLKNVFPKNRRDVLSTAPFVWLKQQHPAVKRAAILYADIGGVGANVPGFEKAIQRAGFELVRPTEAVRVTDPDYTGIIRNLQSANVEFLYLFAFEVNMHVRFVRNMKQQGYNPPIKAANIAFNTRFSELLGKDGDGWENHQTFLPFLDPAEKARSKPLADFIDWNNRRYPGGQLDLFPVDGWGYAAYFVDALRIAGGNLTRKTLLDAFAKVPKFDFGGINAATNPATGQGDRCFVMAKHVGGIWRREHPASGGYECNLGEIYKFK
ncbi:MAG TPA: ABC transporter substrate-binding protein [Acidimicrobiales bacterium]|nr:ABC transporter substrate-binding protein [Acidimicrobiales bacterium]